VPGHQAHATPKEAVARETASTPKATPPPPQQHHLSLNPRVAANVAARGLLQGAGRGSFAPLVHVLCAAAAFASNSGHVATEHPQEASGRSASRLSWQQTCWSDCSRAAVARG